MKVSVHALQQQHNNLAASLRDQHPFLSAYSYSTSSCIWFKLLLFR